MKLIQGILYLTEAETGIASGTLKSAKSRGTDGFVFCGMLIQYDALKPVYKLAIAARYNGCPYTWYQQNGFEGHLKMDAAAWDYYLKTNLAPGYREAYTLAARVLNTIIADRSLLPDAINYIAAKCVSLPQNEYRLLKKMREYKRKGYEVLISKKFGNKNSEKITGEIGEWLCGFYSQFWKPTLEFTYTQFLIECRAKQWPTITISRVYSYLHHRDNMKRWYLGRNGELEYIKRYGVQMRTLQASRKNALWFSDGTGLNLMNSDAKQQRMYYVVDNYSQVILGYDISPSETEIAVFRAFKNSLQFARSKPFELRYDNSSAHKRLEQFFTNISGKLHFPCKAYSGRSKSIEPQNNQFLRQQLRQFFHNTGHNRGARLLNNQYNAFAFKAGDDRKQISLAIPSLQQNMALVNRLVQDWNNSIHPVHNKPRLQVYNESLNAVQTPFTELDMVENFWSQTEKIFMAEGLRLVIGKQKYHYDVYAGALPSVEFREQWVGYQFVVRYDPDDLSYVWLFERTSQGLRFVAQAANKQAVHLASYDQTTEERQYIREFIGLQDGQITRAKEQHRQLAEGTGFTTGEIIEKQKQRLSGMSLAELMRTDDDKTEENETEYEMENVYTRTGSMKPIED